MFHNPPDPSILISCGNESNILYNQHQLLFETFHNLLGGERVSDFSVVVTGCHIKSKLEMFFSLFRNTPLVSALQEVFILKSILAAI